MAGTDVNVDPLTLDEVLLIFQNLQNEEPQVHMT
jgi:hypothetical protein